MGPLRDRFGFPLDAGRVPNAFESDVKQNVVDLCDAAPGVIDENPSRCNAPNARADVDRDVDA